MNVSPGRRFADCHTQVHGFQQPVEPTRRPASRCAETEKQKSRGSTNRFLLQSLTLALMAAFGASLRHERAGPSKAPRVGHRPRQRRPRGPLPGADQYNGLRPNSDASASSGPTTTSATTPRAPSSSSRRSTSSTATASWGCAGRSRATGSCRRGLQRIHAQRNRASPIKRSALGFDFSKVISSRVQIDASVKTEKKEGSRLWGIGMACPSPIAPGCRFTNAAEAGWAVLMIPEPVDANHSQVEGRVTYAGDRLNLSGAITARSTATNTAA